MIDLGFEEEIRNTLDHYRGALGRRERRNALAAKRRALVRSSRCWCDSELLLGTGSEERWQV